MDRKAWQNKSDQLASQLLDEMNPDGYWTGELSSSALAVAVAVAALHFHDFNSHALEIQSGLRWLHENVNEDGSFGDTVDSPGNVSTSLLVYAATNLYAERDEATGDLQQKIRIWLAEQGIDVQSEDVSGYILNHYKSDYTFSVPILTLCGLCGVPGPEAFRFVPQLPYELALLPRTFYRFLKLSVVSYAVPALVAVGIVIYQKKRSNLFWRLIRRISIQPALKRLERMMPESGGFLEAIPLTAFVALSLIEAGYRTNPVVGKGISFLKQTQRANGSWPIDVDLSTWVTSLAVKSMRGHLNSTLNGKQKQRLITHFLNCQNKRVHPFNGSKPGGWGWTNFSGSVPDGDDTSGVILALLALSNKPEVSKAVADGCLWLRDLQNADGGFPTFSRGWGKLPFDQSTCDLTGHCILALTATLDRCGSVFRRNEKKKMLRMIDRAVRFLENEQEENGSWLPLWFGNQQTKDHSNPVYGTARVLTYLQDAIRLKTMSSKTADRVQALTANAQKYLLKTQNEDGSWGGDLNIKGSIEETALAVATLTANSNFADACSRGIKWLGSAEEQGLKASPIGLYFASLWYHEKLYPLTCYLEAVNRLVELDPSSE